VSNPNRTISTLLCLSVVLVVVSSAGATPVVLSEAPAYRWYHGCGPTAAAEVLGYWDLHGYGNLFPASGADLYLTDNVRDQISSPEHNMKYDPSPDDANLPVPPMTSIADWFRTSVDPLDYGWSYLRDADDAFTGYAAYRGYTFRSWYELFGWAFTWEDLVGEINAGRPMMFLVDSGGDGGTDHFVPVLGYDDRGADGLWYGYYSTSLLGELENVQWKQFRPMSSDYSWGVGWGIFAQPEPVPEPASMLLLVGGASVLIVRRRFATRS